MGILILLLIMRNLVSFLIVLGIFLFVDSSAQAGDVFTVKGRVYNTKNARGIANASIVVRETSIGTSSGPDGYFELRLPAGKYNIRISSMGFSGKDVSLLVPAKEPEFLRIGLEPGEIVIEGIDVVGVHNRFDRDTSINSEPVSLMPSVTRISSVEIERQGAVTLTDAFKYVPGGWIETRGRKTKQFFSVRGQKYPYPDYSINGIWQKEFEETVYFFSAMDIESVEIVRSSGALVKGLSGLSGLVDVRTKKPERQTVSFSSRYGEQNQYATNLRYGNKINGLRINTSASFFGTDGPPGRNGRERIINLHGDMDWEISNRLAIQAGTTYIGGSRAFVKILEPGSPNILNREEEFDPMQTFISYAKLNYLGECGSLTELQTNLSYRDAHYSSLNISSTEGHISHQEKDYEYGLNLLHSRPVTSSNTLRAGVIYNHWVAPDGKRYYAGRRANLHTWSGVVASEQSVGRFILDAGFRLIGGYIVEWGGFGIEGSAAGFQDVPPVKDQAAPLEWQSVLGASYLLSGQSSIHYNFAGGTVSPRRGSIDESLNRPGQEARFQHDLGLKFRSSDQAEFSMSAFFATRNDALELSGKLRESEDGYLIELYENLDKRSYGMELSGKFDVTVLHSTIFANATFMKGENEANGEWENDDKMPNMIFNSGIMFGYLGFDGNLFVNYTGPYTNNRFVNRQWIMEYGDFPLGDFFSLDVTAGYTFVGRYSTRVFIEAKNILDQEYLTVAGYPDAGRLISMGARVYF